MKRRVLPVLCVYEAAGLGLYLYRTYEAGLVISFSVFTIADLFVWTAAPYEYILFMLFPVMAGCLFILRGRPSGARMLLYQSRLKLLQKQCAGILAWNSMITLLYIAVAGTAGLIWQKELINWGSARSYPSMVMHIRLPQVQFAEVLSAYFTALFLRNLIFMLALMIFWWADRFVYGAAVVSGICFVETGTNQVKIVLRTVSIDYNFWAYTANKAVFAGSALVFAAALLFLLRKTVKRKEF